MYYYNYAKFYKKSNQFLWKSNYLTDSSDLKIPTRRKFTDFDVWIDIAYDEVTGKQSPPPNAVNDSVPVPSEVSAPVTISKDATSYPILIRVTNGASKKDKKIKYSTVVENKDLEDFWKEYANVLKNGITGLKKKDKKKNKKKKTKAGVSKWFLFGVHYLIGLLHLYVFFVFIFFISYFFSPLFFFTIFIFCHATSFHSI